MVIKIVTADDWQGLYIDNKLYNEAHHIDLEDGLQEILEYRNGYLSEKNYDDLKDFFNMSIENYYVDYDWLEEVSNYPEWFGEIPEEAFE